MYKDIVGGDFLLLFVIDKESYWWKLVDAWVNA